MNDTYKLQLRHGAESRNFSTRDEVIGYINGKLQYGGVSLLPYEPILFFYGADNAKNAIIMVGLPEGKTQEGKSYFLVDTADLKEQIESLVLYGKICDTEECPSTSEPTLLKLREMAKAKKIKGYTKMTKEELLEALKDEIE